MNTLSFSNVAHELHPTAAWASALLLSLARDEAAGRRPVRITEPRLATWSRFKGRLTTTDLVALLFEDAAVLHRIPFDASAVGGKLRLDDLAQTLTESWFKAIPEMDLKVAGAEFIAAQARALGLPTKLARSDLHVVKPHQKVLELPGTGGQLAHHLISSQSDLSLQDNFTIVCSSWEERTLAGLVALDCVAPHVDFIVSAELSALRDANHPLRQRPFDLVIGLHPDKGGYFRVEDQLAIWFSGAKILLV